MHRSATDAPLATSVGGAAPAGPGACQPPPVEHFVAGEEDSGDVLDLPPGARDDSRCTGVGSPRRPGPGSARPPAGGHAQLAGRTRDCSISENTAMPAAIAATNHQAS